MSVPLPGGCASGGAGGGCCKRGLTRVLLGYGPTNKCYPVSFPYARGLPGVTGYLNRKGLGQVVLAETNNVSSKRDLQEKEPPLKLGLGQVVLAETNNVSSKSDLQEKEPPLKLGLGQVVLAETNNVSSKRDLQENDQLS